MPDQGTPLSLIQNSFATGEVSPKLYGRTDLQKYHSGCAFLRNFYVDYRGGVTARPGSQYIGGPGTDGYARLIPFQFSPNIGQTYMLVFSNLKLRIIKNPGGPAYPNSSNAAFITSGGPIYEIVTPYLTADLRGLHVLQIADVMWITAHGYARRKLERLADNNWVLSTISTTPDIAPPTVTAINISPLPGGSTDPEQTRYMYAVAAVNADGVESLPSTPFVSAAGIDIATTKGTVTVYWTPIADAVFYRVYKALPTSADRVPSLSEQFGFVGFAYGTLFTDSNIVADFKQSPLLDNNPFNPGGIAKYSITSSSADWPVGSTTVTVTDGTGTGAIIYPVLDNNVAGGVGSIVGLYIREEGHGYTAPTIAAAGGGTSFVATLTIGPTTGIEPDVVGLVQQRIVYASSDNKPNSIFASRPGAPDDFRITNPTVDNDAFEFAIASTQVNDILWLRSMPGGLVIGTNSGIVQLTGGSSSASNPVAITPTNAVVVPQSNYGTADISPVVIDYNILFVSKSGLVIDLQYNFFINIFTGTDITVLSSHLFEGQQIVEWAYQDVPRKVVWAVVDNGQLLSLTYLKAQEIQGWAHHDTFGNYESIATVQEGDEIAVYVSVRRFGQARRFIERFAGSHWRQRSDAWQLDSALSVALTFPNAAITMSAVTGLNVLVTADTAVFVIGDVGKRLTAGSGYGIVSAYISSTQIRVNIVNSFINNVSSPPTSWHLDALVSTVSGLGYLNGASVLALVDGVPQGRFIVSGGAITLTTPGYMVVVGLQYVCQFQPLYIDVGGDTTVQGRRKKITAASIRVENTAELKYGLDFDHLRTWVAGQSSTDPKLTLPYQAPDLYTGDQRMVLDQYFTVGGWVCVQQELPLPAQILSIEPEVAQGDTR